MMVTSELIEIEQLLLSKLYVRREIFKYRRCLFLVTVFVVFILFYTKKPAKGSGLDEIGQKDSSYQIVNPISRDLISSISRTTKMSSGRTFREESIVQHEPIFRAYTYDFDSAQKSLQAKGQAMLVRARAYGEKLSLNQGPPGCRFREATDRTSIPRSTERRLALRHEVSKEGDVIVGNVRFVRISKYSRTSLNGARWRKRIETHSGPRKIFQRIDSDTRAKKADHSSKLKTAVLVSPNPDIRPEDRQEIPAKIDKESPEGSKDHTEAAEQILTDISEAKVEKSTEDLKTTLNRLNNICKRAVETCDAMLTVRFDDEPGNSENNKKGAENGDE